jgi:hypothetical protein
MYPMGGTIVLSMFNAKTQVHPKVEGRGHDADSTDAREIPPTRPLSLGMYNNSFEIPNDLVLGAKPTLSFLNK